MAITIRKPTEEFKDGFNFAIKMIYDHIETSEDYTLEKLINLLEGMIELINQKHYWPDIKNVIIKE